MSTPPRPLGASGLNSAPLSSLALPHVWRGQSMALIVAPPGDRPWPERGRLAGAGETRVRARCGRARVEHTEPPAGHGLTQADVEAREAARRARSMA